MKTGLAFVLFLFFHLGLLAQPAGKKSASLSDTALAVQLNKTAFRHVNSGEPDSAIYYAQKALSVFTKYSNKTGMARSYNILGIVSSQKSDFEKALGYYSTALNLLGDSAVLPANYILNGIAIIYANQGRLGEAADYYYRSLKVSEAMKDSIGVYTTYSNLGQIYFQLEKYKEAMDSFDKAYLFFRSRHDTVNMAILLDLKATIYSDSEPSDLKKAMELHTRALAFARSNHNTYSESAQYLKMGRILLMMDPPDTRLALSYLFRSLGLKTELEDQEGITNCLSNIGKAYLILNNTELAIEYLNKCLKAAQETENTTVMKDVEGFLYEAYERQGNAELALHHYKNFIALQDSVTNEANTKKIMQSQLNYEFEKKQFALEQEQLKKEAVAREAQKKQTLIIWTISGLFVLLLIIAFLVIRQVRFKNREREMQLEQKLLRSQMNPHFIFNSLQAIQNYILKHNEKEAVRYLGSFASLTRSVLENSRLDVIPLRKEIALLENYLQLQKLRFDNEFEYTISLGPGIDVDEITIPPMLSQPFIENALEHGLSSVTQGLIQISFRIENNKLFLEITDNGSGIDPEKIRNRMHVSLATVITKERIALLNKKMRSIIEFAVSEAYPGKERKGVRVSFSIPMPAVS